MNVQNIPRDDKVVKAAFRPKLDAFVYFDYPNIELKLLAYYLEKIGHPSMAEVFRNGADLHIETAAGALGIPRAQVGDAERQIGKRLNFSIVYGGGIPTLTEQLKISSKEALGLLKGYHRQWPGIGWQTRTRDADDGTLAWWINERINTRGYITTLWGRHLHPHSGHVALNALCQGCAADLMKAALIKTHRWMKADNLTSHLVNVVHDELQIDAEVAEIQLLVERVPDLMNHTEIDNIVPIRPDPDISWTTWADKKPYQYEGAIAA